MEKLVRDEIPSIIKKNGGIPLYREASKSEYAQALRDKLQEEVREFIESGEDEELADILEVIYALCDEKNISFSDLTQIGAKKRIDRGGFTKKYMLKLN